MMMTTTSVSAVTCSARGILEQYCNSSFLMVVVVATCAITYTHGLLVIYLHRNHRFSENNSLKRRFAYIQIANQTTSLGIILFHFRQDVP